MAGKVNQPERSVDGGRHVALFGAIVVLIALLASSPRHGSPGSFSQRLPLSASPTWVRLWWFYGELR